MRKLFSVPAFIILLAFAVLQFSCRERSGLPQRGVIGNDSCKMRANVVYTCAGEIDGIPVTLAFEALGSSVIKGRITDSKSDTGHEPKGDHFVYGTRFFAPKAKRAKTIAIAFGMPQSFTQKNEMDLERIFDLEFRQF